MFPLLQSLYPKHVPWRSECRGQKQQLLNHHISPSFLTFTVSLPLFSWFLPTLWEPGAQSLSLREKLDMLCLCSLTVPAPLFSPRPSVFNNQTHLFSSKGCQFSSSKKKSNYNFHDQVIKQQHPEWGRLQLPVTSYCYTMSSEAKAGLQMTDNTDQYSSLNTQPEPN